MKQKFYWKVVETINDKYESLFQTPSVEYKKNEKTFPPQNRGPLTVLKTLKAARHLKQESITPIKSVILKVRAELSRQRFVWNIFDCKISVKELEYKNQGILLPGHTKLAKWVEVVEEVKD